MPTRTARYVRPSPLAETSQRWLDTVQMQSASVPQPRPSILPQLCTTPSTTHSVLRCVGNHESENPFLPSEESTANADPSWTANLKEPSIVPLDALEPGLAAGLSSLLPKIQGSSGQPMPTTFKLDRTVQPHRAVHWVWMLSSMFLMFLLIATCFDTHFNTSFIAFAFLPSLLGQQTAYWGLAFKGWGHDTQRRRANWFFKASK